MIKKKIVKKKIVKKKVTKKKVVKKEKPEIKVKYSNFIFDDKEIVKTKVFTSDILKENTFAFGVLLPRYKELKDKKNEIIGREQIFSPVLITSNEGHKLIEVTKEIESKFKFKFSDTPKILPLRWELNSIEKYLNRKDEKVSSKELFDKIKFQYIKFLYFQKDEWYSVHALWDIGTYLYNLFNAFPLFELRSYREGTGKTKTMKVSRLITLNATEIMVSPTEAVLFRTTNDIRPTKYIDEAEKLFTIVQGKPEPNACVELINSSYSKGSVVLRLEKIGNKYVALPYYVYSPTMLGSIKGLYGATESRAITHILTRPTKKDDRGNLEVEDYEKEKIWKEIRNELYLFTLQNWKEIKESYENFKLPKDSKIKNRDFQIWKPILCLSKFILNEKEHNKIVDFAENISERRVEDMLHEDTTEYKLFEILLETIYNNVENQKLRPKKIREEYVSMHGSEYAPREKTITNILDNYGLKDFKNRKDRKGISYSLTFEEFRDIIEPFCPSLFFEVDEKIKEIKESEEIEEKKKKMRSEDYSSFSSDSSLSKENEEKKVTKGDEYNKIMTNNKNIPPFSKNKDKKKGDECDDYDECDALLEKEKKKKIYVSEQKAKKILEEFEK